MAEIGGVAPESDPVHGTSGGWVPRWKRLLWRDPFVTVVVIAGLVYSAFALTPSSYGRALALMGAPGEGLYLFYPREVRSDEWAVWTPYLQAAVNNGLREVNGTSIYRENLRNFNALPLRDWAIFLKPQYWPFFVVDPAWAYSFSHAFFYVAFLLGWTQLFVTLGYPKKWGIAAAFLLLFTSYAAMWWTTTGPLLAEVPFVLLVILARCKPVVKALAMAFVSAAWLLSHLYPPVIISLAFVGVVVVLAYSPASLRPRTLAPAAVGLVVGVGIVGFYLWDALAPMASTVYPGNRIDAGGSVSFIHYLAQFFPKLLTNKYRAIVPPNVCEVATGGSFLTLLVLAFLDYGSLRERLTGRDEASRVFRYRMLVLGVGFVLMSLWMVAPVPPFVGRILLWDRVPPARMVFGAGVLLVLVFLEVLRSVPVVPSAARLAGFAAIVVAGWLVSKVGIDDEPFRLRTATELFVLVPTSIVVWLASRGRRELAGGLVAAAALANVAAFGTFNPVQSAIPIFHRPATGIARSLERLEHVDSRHWLAVAGYPGAVLNGWGFRSISHVLIAPKLRFFRSLFPSMPQDEFNQVFNRYAHVQIADVPEPLVPQRDLIIIPSSAVTTDIPDPTVLTATSGVVPAPLGGYLDQSSDGATVHVTGWGLLSDVGPSRRVILVSPSAIERVDVQSTVRADVPAALHDDRLLFSGLAIEIRFANTATTEATRSICVITEDPIFGRHLLVDPEAPERCAGLRAGP